MQGTKARVNLTHRAAVMAEAMKLSPGSSAFAIRHRVADSLYFPDSSGADCSQIGSALGTGVALAIAGLVGTASFKKMWWRFQQGN